MNDDSGLVDALPSEAVLRRSIPWRDLGSLTRREIVSELVLPLPWLVFSLVFADQQWLVPALPCSFMFFLTGLRQVHGAFHYSIGIPRRATELLMMTLSGLMLGSMHAVQINHLRHHAHCLQDGDVEAMSARMPAWKALLTGPSFPVRLHIAALAAATPRQRRWIRLELILTIAVAAAAWLLPIAWLRYHVLAMTVGQCMTSFFAVWTVHHDCDADGIFARTIRGRLKAWATYDMFYHLEHHLFPAVPTRRLPDLARRLDAIDPQLSSKRVF
jgi:fatty acid desaturase